MRGLSQKDMAALLYKSQSTYSRMESGALSITVEELLHIAVALDCTPEDILTDKAIGGMLSPEGRGGANNPFENDTPVLNTYYKDVAELLADHQHKVQEQINQLAKEAQQQMIQLFQEIIIILKRGAAS